MSTKPGSPYRRRIPRADRRVMLALLSGAGNLSGYPLARAAQVGYGKAYVILIRLERAGWVQGEWEPPDPLPDDRPRRRYYRLTDTGREHAMAVLGLTRGRAEHGTARS
jgi:PadR family transcriptional regulator PadR